MSEEVKQEGEFKAKKPSKHKNLGKTNEVTKVEIPSTAVEAQGEVVPEVTKVEIKEEDAVQTQETDGSDVAIEGSEDSSDSQEVVEEVRETDEKLSTPIQEITEDELDEKEGELTKQNESERFFKLVQILLPLI